MDRFEILAVLQALSIYIIMRLDDTEAHADIDNVLIMTVVVRLPKSPDLFI